MLNRRALAAVRAAFPMTVPILSGFFVLGCAYGMLMDSSGFGPLFSAFMSAALYAGAAQFAVIGALAGQFAPLDLFLLTLLINARLFFYGVSMLDRYRDAKGIKKFFLIHTLTDESFSVNINAQSSDDVDVMAYMTAASLLIFSYWVASSALGGLLGVLAGADVRGFDFVLTALFLVIFTEQWLRESDHRASLLGLGASALCLAVAGPSLFVVCSMAVIVAALALFRARFEDDAR